MAQWFRSWHGAPTDTKWLAVARRANVAPGIVSAVVWALFDHASQADTRGSVEGFDIEAYAAFSGFDESDIEAVMSALRDKGIVTDDTLSAWEKRQPKREDDSGERVKRYRQKTKADNDEKRDVTLRNAPDTEQKQSRAEQSSTAREGDSVQDDYDEKVREYLDCVGEHASPDPRSLDISPLTALVAKGYDWHRDVLATIRERRPKLTKTVSPGYFVPIIQERFAIPEKPKQEPSENTQWVPETSLSFERLAGRMRAERGKDAKPHPSRAGNGEPGYFFPTEWVLEPPEILNTSRTRPAA